MKTPTMTLIQQNLVKIKGHGNDRVFWEVGKGDNKVSIIQTKTKFGDQFNCTCKSCSVAGESAGICTFVKSVITYNALGVKAQKPKAEGKKVKK